MDLKAIPGIGDAISKKIKELIDTNEVQAFEKLKAELPDGVLTLMNVPGIGPKTASMIAKELGVATLQRVEEAALDGSLAALPRMGEKSAETILRHIRSYRTKDQRTPLGQAMPVAEEIISNLRSLCPRIGSMQAVGSLRRWKETIGDIDIMCTADDPAHVMDTLVGLPVVREVLVHGLKKSSVFVDPGIQIDMRVVESESFGAMLQYFTGSQQHNIRLRDYANQQGLSLNEYGITDLQQNTLEKYADEASFYERLGLQIIPPEIREGLREIDLAKEGALPALVETSDIKGDLHVHTEWSDGRDPIHEMIAAAVEIGYQYVAITDHSSGRGIANGPSNERLLEQMSILRSMKDRTDIKVLHGSEVDIRSDGSLDYPDHLLAELDIVVGSVHSSLGQDSEHMTARIIAAMHNPHVTIIGHPTGRLLGSREPSEVDMEALFKAALETGTAMEINSAPERLDLKDTHIMRAQQVGVPLVISTDSHSHTHLDKMRFGVASARRGWCEPKHILNTLPAEEFLHYIRTPKPHRISIHYARL